MRAVVTVVGRNHIGIVAAIAARCADWKLDILEIEQTLMSDIFTMMLMVDLRQATADLADIAQDFSELGEAMQLEIRVRHEDTFRVMHELDGNV